MVATQTGSRNWGHFQLVQIPWVMPVKLCIMTGYPRTYYSRDIAPKGSKLGLPHKPELELGHFQFVRIPWDMPVCCYYEF